jgi:hypothetical protein
MNTTVLRSKVSRSSLGLLFSVVLANATLTRETLAEWPLRDRDLEGSRSIPGATVNVDLQAYTSIWEKPGIEFILTGDVWWDSELEVVAQSSSGIHVYTPHGNQATFINMPSILGCLADVSNDGRKEILLGKRETDNNLSVYVYSGVFSGLPLLLKRIGIQGSGQPDQSVTPLFVADIDNDSQLEIVSAGDSGFAIQWRGLEASSLTTGNRKWRVDVGPTTTWGFPTRIGDVDGDGVLEIIQGSGGPANGRTGQDGSVDSASYTWRFDPRNGQTAWRRQYDCCGFYDSHAFLPDLSGDGRPEIVTTTRRHDWSFGDYGLGTINILSPATGATANTIDFGHYTEYGMFGNLDGATGDEIIVMTYEGTTGHLRAYGNNLTPKGDYSRSGGWFYPIAICDLTGDGTPEVLAVFSNGSGAGNDKLLILDATLSDVLHEVDFGVPDIKQVILSDLDKNGTVEILAVVTGKLVVMSPVPTDEQIEDCLLNSSQSCIASLGSCLLAIKSAGLSAVVDLILVLDDACRYAATDDPRDGVELVVSLVALLKGIPCVGAILPCFDALVQNYEDSPHCGSIITSCTALSLRNHELLGDGATKMFGVATLSPVEIEIVDGEGKRLYLNGDGEVVSEMDGGWIFSLDDHRRFGMIVNPVGPVTVIARGTPDAGAGSTFTLGLLHPAADGYTDLQFTDAPILAGAVATISIDESSTEFELAVDLDADGQTDVTSCPAFVNGQPNLSCDNDGDGLPDAFDNCPDTPAGAIVNADGCSIDQLVPCDGPWRSHEQYVRQVVIVANQFEAAGLITRAQKLAIKRAAIHSDCGRRHCRR